MNTPDASAIVLYAHSIRGASRAANANLAPRGRGPDVAVFWSPSGSMRWAPPY